MCDPVAAVGAVVGVVSGMSGAKNQMKYESQQIDAQRRQQRELIKQNNWGHADNSLSIQDSHEQTRQALTETNIKRMNTQAMLSTALGEGGIGGNTAKRLKTVGNIQANMQDSDITLNYQRDYQAIFADSVGRTESTKAEISGMAKINRTSKLTHALNIAQSGMTGISTAGSLNDAVGRSTEAYGSVRKAAGKTGTK